MLQLRPHLPLKEEGRPSLTKEARPLKAHAAPLMTKCQYLKEEWLAVAKLRLKQLEEIRELLAISPKADVDEVLRILKWWRETGKVSIPKKTKTSAHRLLSEFYRLDEASLEILDELEAVPPATASPTKASVASALKTIYGHKRMPRHGRLSGQAGTTKETMSANRI